MSLAKVIPTKVGANDKKKIAILGGLGVVLVVVWFINSSPSVPNAAPTPQARPTPNPSGSRAALPTTIPTTPRVAIRGGVDRSIADFRPTLKLKEGTDVSKIDPSLHLELLAKVRAVTASGGSRSLFEFAQPPAPPPPEVAKIYPRVGPMPLPPAPPPTAPVKTTPPPPPPIPLKFYGYSGTARSAGVRRAFFLEGEDIFVAGENELVHNRYKIVRIGVNSAVVEDTQNKNQQTLPLIEELGS